MKRIVSRANASFKSLRALNDSAHERRARGQTLLDGAHLVRAYVQRIGHPVLAAVSADALEDREIVELLRMLDDTPVLCFAPPLFVQLAPVEHPTGIVALIDLPEQRSTQRAGDFIVLLDRIQDPGNVGAIIRSAAGAGADAVLLCPACADPWSPRALRAAMGGTFLPAIHTGVDLARCAQRYDGAIIATAGRGGVPPDTVDLTGRVALLLGSEGGGLSAALAATATATVTIPLAGAIESLNVGAAAAVVMFERVRQLAISNRRSPAPRTG